MNKSVMALAVAGALAAPAAMAQIQIGGGIHLQYFQGDSDRPNFEKADYLATSEPEIYFRGEEKLGGGLSAWFQCTSSFDVLGIGAFNGIRVSAVPTTVGAQGAQWCGRNSAIGFRGDFGNFFFGNWDTPHKLVTNLARGWWGGTNNLQGGSAVILYNSSDSGVPNTGSSFFRRHARAMNYHSPDWGGFSLQGAISSSNESTGISSGGGQDKPRMMGLAGQFRTGPFFAGLGYESHDNFQTLGGAPGATITNGSDQSMNAVVGFTFFGALRVSGMYTQVEYKPDVGAATEHDGFAVYVDWTLSGPHKLYAQYAKRNETEVGGVEAANSDAEVLGFAYGYNFSKRTQVYVAYNSIKNGSAAAFTLGFAPTTVGGTVTAIGLGLRHSF